MIRIAPLFVWFIEILQISGQFAGYIIAIASLIRHFVELRKWWNKRQKKKKRDRKSEYIKDRGKSKRTK